MSSNVALDKIKEFVEKVATLELVTAVTDFQVNNGSNKQDAPRR